MSDDAWKTYLGVCAFIGAVWGAIQLRDEGVLPGALLGLVLGGGFVLLVTGLIQLFKRIVTTIDTASLRSAKLRADASVSRKLMVERFEEEAKEMLRQLQPPPPPPKLDDNKRARLAMQIQELRVAREHITRHEPQDEFGKALVECDAKISHLEKELQETAESPTEIPHLYGRAVYDEAIARLPDNPMLYVERALYFRSTNDPKSAFADGKRALKLLPGYYYALNMRGLLYEDAENYWSAIREFHKAISDQSYYPPCYTDLARVYNALGKPRDAIEAAKRAADWNYLPAHEQLGIAYEQLGDLENAVHHFTKIIQQIPRPNWASDIRTRRARLLSRLGQVELAIHDLKSQLVDGHDDEARELLAQLED